MGRGGRERHYHTAWPRRPHGRARAHLRQKVILGVQLKRFVIHLHGGLAGGLRDAAEAGGGGRGVGKDGSADQTGLQLVEQVDAHNAAHRGSTDDRGFRGSLHLELRRPGHLGHRHLRRHRRGSDAAEGRRGRDKSKAQEGAHYSAAVHTGESPDAKGSPNLPDEERVLFEEH